MRRLDPTSSLLGAAALALTTFATACADTSDPYGGAAGGDDTIAPSGGGQSGGGVAADAGSGGGGPGEPGATIDAAAPSPPDAGAPITPTPGHDAGGVIGTDAAATCAIGPAGPVGLVPGATMDPGTGCVSCHATTGARKLNVGGTVYTRLGEPDQCIGVSTGVSVVVTDAQGTAHTLSVNSSGNFYDVGLFGFPTPYKAKVVTASGSVEMISAQTNGDCNACHTSAGTQRAAGRIIGP